jgi:UDP-N-acetylmuramoyl-tripeptide--D-alanyl-D-alanine ligase
LNLEGAIERIKNFDLKIGRGKIVKINNHGKTYRIITDYYNSGPKSLGAALTSFKNHVAIRKVGIVGDMRELGSSSGKFHAEIADKILDAGIEVIFLVGEMVQHTKDALNGRIDQVVLCKNFSELNEIIDNYIKDGDLILIKGSRGIRLDKVAEKLGVENAL